MNPSNRKLSKHNEHLPKVCVEMVIPCQERGFLNTYLELPNRGKLKARRIRPCGHAGSGRLLTSS